MRLECIAAALALATAGCATHVDGVWVATSEAARFHYHRLVLDRGRYEQTVTSDVRIGDAEDDPIDRGSFEVRGDRVRLYTDHGHQDYTHLVLNGRRALFSDNAVEWWEGAQRLQEYGILIRSPYPADDPRSERPISVDVLRDEALRAKEEAEYQARFSKVAQPLGELLRGWTDRDDHDGTAYLALLERHRRQPRAETFQQLVELASHPVVRWHEDGQTLLTELLCTDGVGGADPFRGDDAARRLALRAFIDAWEHISSRRGLELCVEVFLHASRGVPDLPESPDDAPPGGAFPRIAVPGTEGRVSVLHLPRSHEWQDWRGERIVDSFVEGARSRKLDRARPPRSAEGRKRLRADREAAQAWARVELERLFPG